MFLVHWPNEEIGHETGNQQAGHHLQDRLIRACLVGSVRDLVLPHIVHEHGTENAGDGPRGKQPAVNRADVISTEQITQVCRNRRQAATIHAQQHGGYPDKEGHAVQVVCSGFGQEVVENPSQREKNKICRLPADKVGGEFLAATLSELASDDAMFFADTSTACIWLARHIYGGKNRRLFGSFSWASMANAALNAFGCALAYPGRQCIALCGDGGFTMLGMGDLLTQIERRTRVVQVILNNEKFDFVHIEQQEAGIIPFGVEFKNPNFAKVAEAMGAKGIRIEEPEDVREGLAEALAYKDGPVVVDAVVDPLALAMPSHSPFHTVKGFTLSFAKQVLSGRLDTVIKEIERNVGIV